MSHPDDTAASHLSQIRTRWSLLRGAHGSALDAAQQAQAELMDRYAGAIYRYLVAALRDPHDAGDLAQEFAVRLLEGRFERASPEHGRFRDFLKAALRNLVTDFHRKKKPQQLIDGFDHGEDDPNPDETFIATWRQELLDKAWAALEVQEKSSKQPFYTVLRYRVEHPDVRSAQMAEVLEGKLGKRLSEEAMRKTLQRARDDFADHLIDEVGHSLGGASLDRIQEELADLGLLPQCSSRLAKRRGG
jgi:RNA polymerase sigma factor (sigma-70 family)